MRTYSSSSENSFLRRIKAFFRNQETEPPRMRAVDVMDTFNGSYNRIAITIDSHLRYEKDFSGEDSLSQGISDPFSIADYAQSIIALYNRLLKLSGPLAVDSHDREIAVSWIVISQLLYPAKRDIQDRLKQNLRNELTAQVLHYLWQQGTEPFGRFIRRYYEAVYQSPPEILSSITADELIRHFKTASQIADKLISDQKRNQDTPSKTKTASGESQSAAPLGKQPAKTDLLLATISERFGLTNQSAVRRLLSRGTGMYILLSLWLILVLYLLITTTVVSGLMEVTPSSGMTKYLNTELLHLLLLPIAVFAAPVLFVQIARCSRRRALRRGFVLTMQSLITSRIVTQRETHLFFSGRFGQRTARSLLKGLS